MTMFIMVQDPAKEKKKEGGGGSPKVQKRTRMHIEEWQCLFDRLLMPSLFVEYIDWDNKIAVK